MTDEKYVEADGERSPEEIIGLDPLADSSRGWSSGSSSGARSSTGSKKPKQRHSSDWCDGGNDEKYSW